MIVMKKRTAIAVGVGMWVAAMGSAAALTRELNRPLHWAGGTPNVAAPTSDTPAPAVAQPAAELPPVIYVPAVTVVGTVHRPILAREPKPAKDIAEMHCADWRGLVMGSGRVQVCD
jgi:hypothetical protein